MVFSCDASGTGAGDFCKGNSFHVKLPKWIIKLNNKNITECVTAVLTFGQEVSKKKIVD